MCQPNDVIANVAHEPSAGMYNAICVVYALSIKTCAVRPNSKSLSQLSGSQWSLCKRQPRECPDSAICTILLGVYLVQRLVV